MIESPLPLFLTLMGLVGAMVGISRTPWGQKIGQFAPTPFWVYFVPIVLATLGILPHTSPVYDKISLHILPAALVLLLVGTPVSDLFKMSWMSIQAILAASLSMLVAALLAFLLLFKFLPPESYKAVGAILGTWVGGSANMLALKEILIIPDGLMAPLIIVDTFLSYAWMALLVFAAGWQKPFDLWARVDSRSQETHHPSEVSLSHATPRKIQIKIGMVLVALVLALAFGTLMVGFGQWISLRWPFLTSRAWTVLATSLLAVGLAMTRLRHLEKWGASRWGGYLLYLVLATIGVQTTLRAAQTAPVYLVFGGVILILHGSLMILVGRVKHLPLFLLSTSSQAAVGGPVSAPIVAEIYRPGSAHIGVLMAIFGALIGTYVGLLGSWICLLITRLAA